MALNASTELKDLWVADATAWLEAPVRRIEFPDMVLRRRGQMLHGQLAARVLRSICFWIPSGDVDLRGLVRCEFHECFAYDSEGYITSFIGSLGRRLSWIGSRIYLT